MKPQTPSTGANSVADTPKKTLPAPEIPKKRPPAIPALPVSVATPSTYCFPDETQQKRLVAVYFEKVHPAVPVFGLAAVPDLLASMTNPQPPLYAVILSSLRFCGPLMAREESTACWNHCRDHLMATCLYITDLDQLRAMTLLAVDLFGRQKHREAATVVALVSAAATRLDLHRESSIYRLSHESNPQARAKILVSRNTGILAAPAPWRDEEARRNVFWEIFLLEKVYSVHMGSPAIIPEDITCLLPASIDLWMAGNSVDEQHRKLGNLGLLGIYDSNCFLLEVIYIMGQAQRNIQHGSTLESSPWTAVDSQIHAWRANLPMAYLELLDADNALFKNTFSVKDVVFHGLYHALIIMVYVSRAYTKSSPTKEVQSARTRTLDLAVHLAGLAKQLPLMFSRAGDDAYALCGPYYAFSLWTGARLLLVHSFSTGADIPPAFDFLMRLLLEIGKKWDLACRYVDVLRHFRDQIRRRRNSYQSSDGALDEGLETVGLVADWRLSPQTLWQLCENEDENVLDGSVGKEMSRKRSWNEEVVEKKVTQPSNGQQAFSKAT